MIGGRDRRVGLVIGAGLAVLLAAAGTGAADTPVALEPANALTEQAITAERLAEHSLELAAGALAVGVGLGTVLAGGVTYWYKNREFQRRLNR